MDQQINQNTCETHNENCTNEIVVPTLTMNEKLDELLKDEPKEVCDTVRLLASIGEEITMEHELVNLVKSFQSGKKTEVTCYDGFEPSGRMHIAQGLIRALNVNKFTKCGFKFKFWVADWFAQMNLKFGGDLKKIRKAGDLMIHMWRACGMDMENVEFIWAAASIDARSMDYWQSVIDINSSFTVGRLKKCGQIMGRDESDSLMGSQLLYPAMQCADIFHLGVDICSLGIDQRKVNMLAREYSSKKKHKFHPIIISHHMLSGLDGSDKMSKSNPDNAVFMDDSKSDVKRKINQAFCAPGNVDVNPILEYFKYIVFELKDSVNINVLNFETKERSVLTFTNCADLSLAFANGTIHPSDIKPALIDYVNEFLDPVREYVEANPHVKQLVKEVKKFK